MIPIISPGQIRAARALLDWNQGDLAREAGVNMNTLVLLEKGRSSGNSETFAKIIAAFDKAGLTFTEDNGVREKTAEAVKVYEGRDGFSEFRRDVLTVAKDTDVFICTNNADERDFVTHTPVEIHDTYMKAMAKIDGLDFRILVKEGDTFLPASNYAEYRWIPKESFGDIPFYIFGDYTGILVFENENVQIYTIHNAAIAAFMRKQFLTMWERAIVPSGKKLRGANDGNDMDAAA